MIFRIALHEIRLLFRSPLAFIALGIVQALLAYLFLIQVERFMEWQPHLPTLPGAPGVTALVVAPTLKFAGLMMAVLVPMLTMRLVSEERSRGTLDLMLSAPISSADVIFGKFAGVFGFALLTIALITLMPLTLLLGANLDLGLFACGVLGLIALCASFCAAGLFISTLTSQPSAAAIATLGLLLGLLILDWSSGATHSESLLRYLALSFHFERTLTGMFDSRDFAYPLLLTLSFLGLSVLRLEALRGRFA